MTEAERFSCEVQTFFVRGADLMKFVYIVGGVLFGVFAVAQLLQLFGLIGIGFSLGGVGFTIFGGILSFLCFKKALAQPHSS